MWRVFQDRGFTLVELLVVVTIAAILATLAYPSYRQTMHRAGRLEARLALQRIQYLQERHYSEHLRYAGNLGGQSGAENALAMPDHTESGTYLLSTSAGDDGQSFIALAAASEGSRQASDEACQKFEVDEAGRKRSANASGNWAGEEARRCWG